MEKCPNCGKGYFSTNRFKYLTIEDEELLVCPICIKDNERERKRLGNERLKKCAHCGRKIGVFETKYNWVGEKKAMCNECHEKYMNESPEKQEQWLTETKENEKQIFEDVEKRKSQSPPEPEKTESREVRSLKRQKNWFVGVEDATGTIRYFDKKEITKTLRSDILEGKYQKDNATMLYSKKVDGKWEKTSSTLLEFSKKFFKLRVLYQPVWSYAMSGLKWGTIIGIGLRAVDSLIGLASADVVATIICLLVLGLFFIPRVGPFIDIAIIIALSRFIDIMWILGFYFGVAIAGIMLASLPGMAIGGAIGLSRRNTITLARDAPPESKNIHITAFVLPLAIGIVLIAVYFFVIVPWMVSILLG
jgi:hypothetical protein